MPGNAQRGFKHGTKVLEMTIGEESRAKESRIGRRDSLLYECYLKSIEVLGESISQTKRFYEHPNSHGFDNYYTNVIVFDGARGRGKTSAMLTFGKTLDSLNRLTQYAGVRDRESIMREVFDSPSEELVAVVNNLGNPNFVVLPPIDPTILNKSHDLLSTFTARLYQKAQEWWESDEYGRSTSGMYSSAPTASSYAAKDNFLNDIKECYTAISALNEKGAIGSWSMSQLSKMGAASVLAMRFHDAVCSLLEMHRLTPANSFVVLQIDDADMTFANVYEILEDMRCFLKIPNLVVLMAADLTMIENLVRQNFIEEMKHSTDLIQELTEQYMIKSFPLRRQIALPNLNDVLHYNVHRVGLRVWTDERQEVDFFSELYEDEEGGQKTALCMSTSLLRMLYRRTGILLDDTKGYYPWLLPVSQRSIAGFVGLLQKMKHVKRLEKLDTLFRFGSIERDAQLSFYYPSVSIDTTFGEYVHDLENWLANVRMFEYYLLHDWTLVALTHDEGVQFRRIARSSIWDRRIATFKALEALGVKDPKYYDAVKSFAVLTSALDEYKKRHGPRFSYSVRVLESLFAQEYILETLQGTYSNMNASTLVEEANKLDFYTSFPGLKSYYSGNLALDKLAVSKDLLGGVREATRGLCHILFDVTTETKPKSDEECCVRLDAPLFKSLYAVDEEVKSVGRASLEEAGLNGYFDTLLLLQDFMLFLASNWDALRNVIRYFKDADVDALVEGNDPESFTEGLVKLYEHSIDTLLGTINESVLKELGERIALWLKKDGQVDSIPSANGEDAAGTTTGEDPEQPQAAAEA